MSLFYEHADIDDSPWNTQWREGVKISEDELYNQLLGAAQASPHLESLLGRAAYYVLKAKQKKEEVNDDTP